MWPASDRGDAGDVSGRPARARHRHLQLHAQSAREALPRPDLPAGLGERPPPARLLPARLLVLNTRHDDLAAVDLVLLLLRDRHDPEPVQAEQ